MDSNIDRDFSVENELQRSPDPTNRVCCIQFFYDQITCFYNIRLFYSSCVPQANSSRKLLFVPCECENYFCDHRLA